MAKLKGRKKEKLAVVDGDLAELGSRRLIPVADVPDYIDTTDMRKIQVKNHENALINPGQVTVLAEAGAVVDALLDERNKIEPPITKMSDLDKADAEG